MDQGLFPETLRESLSQNMNGSTNESTTEYDSHMHMQIGNFDTWKDSEGRLWAKPSEGYYRDRAAQKVASSGLADFVKKQTFGSFRGYTDIQQRMKATGQQYLQDLLDPKNESNKPWLYVGGCPGSGKTHICTAVCGELMKQGHTVLYMRWLNESRRLKSYINDPGFDGLVSDFMNAEVLYIDDLMKQPWSENPRFTDADIRMAFTILDYRYTANKPTIISSEWSLIDQLMDADEGLFSRVYEKCAGHIGNVDRDMKNNYRMNWGGV